MLGTIIKASQTVGKFVIQHSPTILTIAGCCGVGATAYMSGKKAIETSKKLEELEYTSEHKPTMIEKAKCVAPDMIPVFIIGTTTVLCIIGAHRIHLQRNAALIAYAAMVNEKYRDYRNEVVKEIGKKKEDHLHDKAAQEKINKTITEEKIANAYRTRFGDVLFMDEFGTVWYSSYEQVEKARLKITDIAQRDMNATLNEFYEANEIPTIAYGDNLVWNVTSIADSGEGTVIPIFTNRVGKTPGPEGLPCVLVEYDDYLEPMARYDSSRIYRR